VPAPEDVFAAISCTFTITFRHSTTAVIANPLPMGVGAGPRACPTKRVRCHFVYDHVHAYEHAHDHGGPRPSVPSHDPRPKNVHAAISITCTSTSTFTIGAPGIVGAGPRACPTQDVFAAISYTFTRTSTITIRARHLTIGGHNPHPSRPGKAARARPQSSLRTRCRYRRVKQSHYPKTAFHEDLDPIRHLNGF
jgi:hypothetical protein